MKSAAEAAFKLDNEMSEIREEIQEAQNLFSYNKNKDWSQNENSHTQNKKDLDDK